MHLGVYVAILCEEIKKSPNMQLCKYIRHANIVALAKLAKNVKYPDEQHYITGKRKDMETECGHTVYSYNAS